jgi:hypothetical protein
VKRCQCLIDGSPETKEEGTILMEISPDILQDATNRVRQFHLRLQLSHCKMSVMKYKSHVKSPCGWIGGWVVGWMDGPGHFDGSCQY